MNSSSLKKAEERITTLNESGIYLNFGNIKIKAGDFLQRKEDEIEILKKRLAVEICNNEMLKEKLSKLDINEYGNALNSYKYG